MNITIVSAYTWENKGDAAILLGTIKELEEYFQIENTKVSFNILTFTPDIDAKKYKSISDSIVEVKSNLLNPYPFKKNKLNKSIKIVELGLSYLKLKIISLVGLDRYNGSASLNICKDADLIIICGGGFLGGNKYNSLIHLAQIDIINKLKKRIILWGTSIEPPRKKILKKITESVLSNLDMILPREKITSEYLKEWYPRERIVDTPDMAFKIPYQKTEKIESTYKYIKDLSMGKNLIGITMREWNFPKSSNPKEAKANYEDSLIQLINERGKDSMFIFVPQVIMSGDDDRIFATKIQKEINNFENFLILRDDYSPYELKWLISQFDQFLGTRMHSNIFSSTMFLPPVAIAYEKKTNGIMEKLNLSDYVIDIEEVSFEKLNGILYSNLLNKEQLSSELIIKIKDLKKEIRTATKSILG